MRQSHRLIWNSLVIWSMRVFRLVPELVLLPFLMHRLGTESYGIYVLAWSILPVLALVQDGIGSAVVKYSAEFFGQSKIEHVNKVLSTSCLLLTIIGLISGLLPILVADFVPSFLGTTGQQDSGAITFAFYVLGIMVMLSFPLMPYAGILHSLQRYDLFALVRTVFGYLRAGAIVCCFSLVGPSIEVLVIVSAATEVLSGLCLAIIAYCLVPGLRNRLSLCNRNTAKMMLGFSTMILLCSLCSVINNSGVKWMMGLLVSPAFVAIMAVMLVPPRLMGEVVQGMSLSIMPATSKYSAQRNRKMLRELLVRGTRYMTLVVTVGMMAILLLSKPVLRVWMGAEYEYLSIYVIILCGGNAVWMSTSCTHHMLRGMGMLRSSLACAAVGPVIVTLGTILVVLRIGASAYWALISGLMFGQIVATVMRIAFCTSRTGVRVKELLWHAYGEPMAIAVPVTVIALAAVHHLHAGGLVARITASTVAILVFTGFFGLVFLTQQEKQLARGIFQSVYLRMRGMLSPSG